MNEERRNAVAAQHFQATARSWTDRYTEGHGLSPGFLVRRNAVLEQLRELPGGWERAIDIGCGTGPYLPFLAELAGEVTGVDVAPAMLEQARRNLPSGITNVRLCEASALKLPFPDGHFDVGISVGVLEYFDNPRDVLTAVFRVIKPGGRVIFTLPSTFSLSRLMGLPRTATLIAPPRWKVTVGAWADRIRGRDPDPSKYYLGASFTCDRIRRLCRGAGLDVIEITSSGFDGVSFAGLPIPSELATKVDGIGEARRRDFPWKYLGNNLIVTIAKPR